MADQSFEEQYEALKLEKMRLEVEEMRNAQRAREAKKEETIRRARQIAADEESGRERLIRLQRACNHRKGGKDRDGLINGNSTDYATIKHTYPTGVTHIHCIRCMAEWKPGDTALTHRTGISYEEAFRFPTDNEPSGGITFIIPQSHNSVIAAALTAAAKK